MAIRPFLAMTAAEIGRDTSLPPKIGWMACHFSPYATGLSNMPGSLPKGSLLILNDRTPIHRHDRKLIAAQLEGCIKSLQCFGVLLDFQRPGCEETALLAEYLTTTLSCPVAVSDGYAGELDCSVFLSPLPHHQCLEDYLSPWKGREVWIELALDSEQITLTKSGTTFLPLPHGKQPETGHHEMELHCHYRVTVSDDAATFTLWRTQEDLAALLKKAEALGVATAVGLFQELQ